MNIRLLAVCTIATSLLFALPAFARPSSPATQDRPASTAMHAGFGGVTPGHPAASSFICATASPPNTGEPPYHHNYHGSCPIAGNATIGAPCTCAGDSYPGTVKAAP